MHAAFYRLYLYLVFIGTSEYFSWFLISSSPLSLDLVAPLPVEERPDVRRGVHHAGEAELALWIPCCCPAILGFVGLWLWGSSRYDVRIQTNLPHRSIPEVATVNSTTFSSIFSYNCLQRRMLNNLFDRKFESECIRLSTRVVGLSTGSFEDNDA